MASMEHRLIKKLALQLEESSYGALSTLRRELDEDERGLLDDVLTEDKAATCGAILSWGDFLTELGICQEDAVGNRPCDNGQPCDKCSADWIHAAYATRTGCEYNDRG